MGRDQRLPSAPHACESQPEINLKDAATFCNNLGKLEKKPPVYRIDEVEIFQRSNTPGYRLPSEAEWEFACRAGSTGLWFSGETTMVDQLKEWQSLIHGAKVQPNPFGLLNLYGGSSEWCFDPFEPDSDKPLVDPMSESVKGTGVTRGCTFYSSGGGDLRIINSVIRTPASAMGPNQVFSGLGRWVLPIEAVQKKSMIFAVSCPRNLPGESWQR